MRKGEVRKMSAGKWCVTVAVLAALCGCLTPLKRDMFGVRLGGKLSPQIKDELEDSSELGVRLVELDAEAPEVEKGKVRSIAVLGKKDVVLAVGYIVEMKSAYDVEMARLRYEQEHGSFSEIGSIDGKFEFISTLRGDTGEAFVTEKSAYGIIRFDRKAVENILRQVSLKDYRSNRRGIDAMARIVGLPEIAEELANRQDIEVRESADGSVRLERNLDTGTNVLTIGTRRIELVRTERQYWNGIDLTAIGSDTGLCFRVNYNNELCQYAVIGARQELVGVARRLYGGESDDGDEKPGTAEAVRPFRMEDLRVVAPGVARYYWEDDPERLNGEPVKDADAIRQLIVDSSVKAIPPGFFANWKNLETVSVGRRRDQRGLDLGSRTFAGCPRLNCIVCPSGSGSVVAQADTFDGCPDDVVMVFDMDSRCECGPWEVRPVMGCPKELHLKDVSEKLMRFGDFYFERKSCGMELFYYGGTNETVHVPAEVNGSTVYRIGAAAFLPPCPVKTLSLPRGCDSWRGSGAYWPCEPPHLEKVLMNGPYSPEIRESAKIDTVYARSVEDRDRSEEQPVVVVPECAPLEEYSADTNRLAKSGPVSYYRHPDGIEVLAYDLGPDGVIDVPDEIEGVPVTKIAAGLLSTVDPRNVRLPDTFGDWALSPDLVGRWEKDLAGYLAATNKADAVRRFAEPREVPSFGRVERLPEQGYYEEGKSVKWSLSDSAGRYAETLARLERGVAKGDVQSKAGLANYLMYGRPGLYGIVNRARARALCEEVVRSSDPTRVNLFEGYALLDALTMLVELDGSLGVERERARTQCLRHIWEWFGKGIADCLELTSRRPLPPLLFLKDPFSRERHFWWTADWEKTDVRDLEYLVRFAAIRGDRAARAMIDEDGTFHPERREGCVAKVESRTLPKWRRASGDRTPAVFTDIVAEGALKAETDPLGLSAFAAKRDKLEFKALVRVPDGAEGSVPLVVYIPGNGELDELVRQFRQRVLIDKVLSAEFQAKHPCGLLALTPPSVLGTLWTGTDGPNGRHWLMKDMIEETLRRYPQLDRRRVYTMGLSYGGSGAMTLALLYPELIAASVPVLPMRPAEFERSAEFPWNFCFCYNRERWRNTPGGEEAYVRFMEKENLAGGDCQIVDIPVMPDSWNVAWQNDEIWDWLFTKHR